MNKKFAALIMLLFAGSASTATAFNAGARETATFADVRGVIDAAVARHGASRVLVAFDLDNTTLATLSDVGSEHWFNWQAELIDAKRFDDGAVAGSVDDLLTLSSWIYTIGRSRLVEDRIAKDVDELARAGVSFMALTSRGHPMRDATLRELRSLRLDFTAMAPGPRGGYGGPYLPYDLATPEASGLGAVDIKKFSLPTAKPVVYEQGVMLTQGQHKGVMLRTLLAKSGASYDAIVFVDDRAHHLTGMQEAFAARPEKMFTVRYTHEAARIEAFNRSDKTEIIRQWCQFAGGVSGLFGAKSTVTLKPCPSGRPVARPAKGLSSP